MTARRSKDNLEEGDHPKLTRREGEILALVLIGKSNRKIAQTLGISESTVRFHLSNIFKKLNVNNRIQALHKAFEAGLIVVSF